MLISTAPPPVELETLSCRVLTIDCQAASCTKSISHVSSYVLINYLVYTPTRTSSNEQLLQYMNCSPLQLETVTLVPITDEVFLVYIENEDSILLLVQPVLC